MKARLLPLIQFWLARSPREQKTLTLWGAVAGTLLLVFGLILPLQQQISRLQRSIPVLESQLFAMRAQPAQGLRPVSAHATGDLRTTLFQLIGGQKHSIDLRSISAERVELRLPALPVAEALALADGLRRDAQARIALLAIQNEGKDKTVRLVLEMERNR